MRALTEAQRDQIEKQRREIEKLEALKRRREYEQAVDNWIARGKAK